jgi:hypothetical protein
LLCAVPLPVEPELNTAEFAVLPEAAPELNGVEFAVFPDAAPVVLALVVTL